MNLIFLQHFNLPDATLSFFLYHDSLFLFWYILQSKVSQRLWGVTSEAHTLIILTSNYIYPERTVNFWKISLEPGVLTCKGDQDSQVLGVHQAFRFTFLTHYPHLLFCYICIYVFNIQLVTL